MHDKVLGSQLPPVLALAYLGDAEYSLFVRRMLVGRGISHIGDLNREALAYVTAERQAARMRKIEPFLTEDERDVYRRAANSKHLNRPKHAGMNDYRAATGFEAVLGMLSWLGDKERMEEILRLAGEEDIEKNDSQN